MVNGEESARRQYLSPWQEDANIYMDFWLLRKFFVPLPRFTRK
jgi:hypothetical protein